MDERTGDSNFVIFSIYVQLNIIICEFKYVPK